jgi:hypothetical protein
MLQSFLCIKCDNLSQTFHFVPLFEPAQVEKIKDAASFLPMHVGSNNWHKMPKDAAWAWGLIHKEKTNCSLEKTGM